MKMTATVFATLGLIFAAQGLARADTYAMADGLGGLLAQRGGGAWQGDSPAEDPADKYIRPFKHPKEGAPGTASSARKETASRSAAPSILLEPWLIIVAVVAVAGGLAFVLGCVLLVRWRHRRRRAGPLHPAAFGLARPEQVEAQPTPAASETGSSRRAA